MLIGMDNFGSTHSPENQALCNRMYLTHQKAGYIDKRSVRQAYDETAKMFLPDRYVKGVCPVCATPDQYGDSCENCGSTYTPARSEKSDLRRQRHAPGWRESEHYFFKLSAFEKRAAARGSRSGAVQESVARKLEEWFSQGLRDWDISRDAPYFGFEIPGCARQVLLRLVRCADRIPRRASRNSARAPACKFDDFLAADSTRRAASLHRQGHPVFSLAFLARGACRPPACAGRPPCMRMDS